MLASQVEAQMVSMPDTQPDRSSRLTVLRAEGGWEVREERDNTTIRVTQYSDWHRVERSIRLFEGTVVAELSRA